MSPVTGTAISGGTGKTLAQLFGMILSRPISSTLGLEPGFAGKISRAQMLFIFNDIISELTPFYPARIAADLLLTASKAYDLSESSPPVKKIYDIKIPMHSGGPLVSSSRWDWDILEEQLHFHVIPVAGVTARIHYITPVVALEADSDRVTGELIGNEQLIISGALGLCGSTKDYGNYKTERERLRTLSGGKMIFPRKLR